MGKNISLGPFEIGDVWDSNSPNNIDENKITSLDTVDAEKFNNFVGKMDDAFLTTLNNYNQIDLKKSQDVLELKNKFYKLIEDMLWLFAISPFVIIILCWMLDMKEASIVTAIIAAGVETFTAFIVLPKIIAEYLFNKDEEKNKIDLIKSMQKYTEGHSKDK